MTVVLIHGVGKGFSEETDELSKAVYAKLLGIPEGELELYDWAKTLDASWLDGTKRRRFFRWNPLRKVLKLDYWGDNIDDVLAYFLDKGTRTKAIDQLRDRLRGVDDATPRVVTVVAHSLGSVLLWQTLHQLPSYRFNVVLLGSPLAMKLVRAKVWLDGCRKEPPANKAVILSGRRDPVAAWGRRWCNGWNEPDLPYLNHDLLPYLEQARVYLNKWHYRSK